METFWSICMGMFVLLFIACGIYSIRYFKIDDWAIIERSSGRIARVMFHTTKPTYGSRKGFKVVRYTKRVANKHKGLA